MTPHLRTSERKDFKRCQQRWQWRWRNGLVPKIEKPGALWFGTGIHLALEERYKYPGLRRGKNVLKVWRDYAAGEQAVIYGDNYQSDPEDFYDAVQLGEIMLGAYLDEYGKDERWHVIAAEQTFELPIPSPNSDDALVLYNGKFDLVARDLEGDESLWLWDHKTAAAIQTGHLSLDDQAGSYWAVAGDVLGAQGLVKPGEKLDGILYNFLRKGKPDQRPRDDEGRYHNKPQKAHYAEEINSTIRWMTESDEYYGAIPMLAKSVEKMTLAELEAFAELWEIPVLGEVSKMQPPPLFHRETVWRTRAERRVQIEKIQAEALQMQAIRSKQLPITKNPTRDCQWDCPFFNMCELHDAKGEWKEFRDMAFSVQDPYAEHRESTEE